jgi:BirA family biotin operon repressor/biotin-[acetyl-CoA-carboxylase] ligase
MDDLTPDRLVAALGQRRFEYHDGCDSTMERARDWCRREPNLPAGSVVIADFQTEGRSRHGKPPWLAPRGTSILMTFIYPQLASPYRCWPAAALAVCDAVSALALLPTIKWPNDVMLEGKKLAGCLVEWIPGPGAALVGMGVNVSCRFPGTDFAERATSLTEHTVIPLDRVGLIASMADAIDRRLTGETLMRDWAQRLETLGQMVSVETTQGRMVGRAEQVTADGQLVVRLDDGSRRTLSEGYVSHLRPM